MAKSGPLPDLRLCYSRWKFGLEAVILREYPHENNRIHEKDTAN